MSNKSYEYIYNSGITQQIVTKQGIKLILDSFINIFNQYKIEIIYNKSHEIENILKDLISKKFENIYNNILSSIMKLNIK